MKQQDPRCLVMDTYKYLTTLQTGAMNAFCDKPFLSACPFVSASRRSTFDSFFSCPAFFLSAPFSPFRFICGLQSSSILQSNSLPSVFVISNDPPMQTELKTAVSLAARTGRHLQRYDNGRRQVVGCVPYRYKDSGETSSLMAEDAFEVLVISPQRKSKGMLFPKGGWETDETIEAAALRETVEEAGVLGEIECKLGTWSFETKNGENSCEGHMFPLLVKEQLDWWPEKEIRQRHWMSVREARKVCKQWWMKEALEAMVGHVTKQKNAGLLSAIGLSQGTLFSIRCGAQILPPQTMASAEEAYRLQDRRS